MFEQVTYIHKFVRVFYLKVFSYNNLPIDISKLKITDCKLSINFIFTISQFFVLCYIKFHCFLTNHYSYTIKLIDIDNL